jgi:hypothetical protein
MDSHLTIRGPVFNLTISTTAEKCGLTNAIPHLTSRFGESYFSMPEFGGWTLRGTFAIEIKRLIIQVGLRYY